MHPMLSWARVRMHRICWIDSAAIEVAVALISLGWGLQLARPEPLFSSPSYHHLALIAREELWAAVMLIAGSAQLTAIVVCSRMARRWAAMAMVGIWWGVATLFWLSSPGSTAPATYTVLALSCTWAFIRLGRPYPRR